jgi:hypothetical protein
MFLLRVSLGFLLIFLGLGYLFDQKSILRFNAFMRELLFRDSYVLLRGRRIGILLLVVGGLVVALNVQMLPP